MFEIEIELSQDALIAFDETHDEVLEYELIGLLDPIEFALNTKDVEAYVRDTRIIVDLSNSDLQLTLKEFKATLRDVFTQYMAGPLNDLSPPVRVTQLK